MSKSVVQESVRFPPDLPPAKELLARYWSSVPLALALREVHRLLALAAVLEDRPASRSILDVGVGDGAWWNDLKPAPEVYGIDISAAELARARRVIGRVARIDISCAEVADRLADNGWPLLFDGIIANCSIEHIPRLDAALENLFRLVRPGGWLVMFVPTPWWAMQGFLQGAVGRLSPRLAMMNAGALNGFFQHWHLMDRPTWTRLLQSHGFEVTRILALGHERTEFLFRSMLPASFLAFLSKQVTGSYPSRWLPLAVRRPIADVIAEWFDTPTADETTDLNAYEFAIRCRRPE